MDAYAMIYRAYYAYMKNPLVNSKGQNTSAIFGFVNTLNDVLKKENPTHIGVAFDPSGKTFRHEAYPEYKANRESTPEDIKFAIPHIKSILRAHNIPVLEVEGYEADDVIGTLAKKAETEGFVTYMMTPDKDYGQLVSETTFMYKPKFGSSGFDTLGVDEVLAKWELSSTAQVIDMLALMGDASDNIPGCPGVGEKTAMKLLKEFSSVEDIIANTDKLKGALQKKVVENSELITFSKFLATIKTDVPMELNTSELELSEANNDELIKIYQELEFSAFLKKLKQGNTTNSAAQSLDLFGNVTKATSEGKTKTTSETMAASVASKNINNTEHTYTLCDSRDKINELVNLLNTSTHFCFDTETTSLDARTAKLVAMSFAITPHTAYCVPISENDDDIVELFRPSLENPNIEKTAHNIKYDMMVMQNYGINLAGKLFDTMIAHYLLQPEQRHSMDFLAETLLDYEPIHIEALIGAKGKNQGSMRDVPADILCDYAAEDADITLQLRHILEPQLSKDNSNLRSLFDDIEMPLVAVLAKMQRTGVIIDDFSLAQSSQTMTAELIKIEREIQEIADEKINVSSPKQIGELLFDKLHIIDKPKKTKTGQYVTDEDTLSSLKDKHPIVDKILDYRGLKKLLSTYIDALPKLIDPKTERIHSSFNQTVTATGRLSSSDPNLQNIPIRNEQGKEIRRAFIPSDNHVFISADYSQIELRIMAHLSQDSHLCEAFNLNQDIHAATAAKIYSIGVEDVDSDMRRKAKTANFGIIYGISAFGLAERLGIPRYEAKELIDGYFASFPMVKTYIDQCIASARELGYVETILGRRRYLADINSRNANVRGFAERNAVNAPIQGAAADIIKIAMIRIDKRMTEENLKAEMILQVHDELNFNCPNNEVDALCTIIREEMEGAIELSVPLRTDIGIGTNWLEAH